MRRWALLLPVVAVAGLMPSARALPRAPASPPAQAARASEEGGARRPLHVLAVGDSLTDPKSHGGGYLGLVQERCPGAKIENTARGGWMVNQMRRRLLGQTLAEGREGGVPAYTHLVVFGGINDVLSDETARRTPALIQRDLGAMYAAARARGMKVVAITLSPWGGLRRWFNPSRHNATLLVNDWIRKRGPAGEVDVVVDAYRLLGCDPPTHLCKEHVRPFNDGLHFGKTGHAVLGAALADAAFPDCE